MRAFVFLIALALPADGAFAQSTPEEVCETTANIVTKAQEMRRDGKDRTEVIETLAEEYQDRGESFTNAAIPMLVNDFVYIQSDEALDQDLAEFWKQTCLATDLSSVLGSG